MTIDIQTKILTADINGYGILVMLMFHLHTVR